MFTVFLSSLFLNTAIVSACSCVMPLSATESLAESTAVFAGKVVDMEVSDGEIISTADPVTVTFEVSKVWKGAEAETIVLTTAREGSSCGYSFEENEEYIVYTHGEADQLSTNSCSRTKLLADAEEDLQELDSGDVLQNSNLMPIILTIGFGISLVVLLVLRRYKK